MISKICVDSKFLAHCVVSRPDRIPGKSPLNGIETATTDLLHIPDTSQRDFLLAPTKEIILYHDLSFWQQAILKKSNSLDSRSTVNLVQTLSDKTNYTVHYITLKLYVKSRIEIHKSSEYYSFIRRAG